MRLLHQIVGSLISHEANTVGKPVANIAAMFLKPTTGCAQHTVSGWPRSSSMNCRSATVVSRYIATLLMVGDSLRKSAASSKPTSSLAVQEAQKRRWCCRA